MDKKAINDEISRYWTAGSDDYDSHHAHGLQSEEEKQAWLDFLKKIIPVSYTHLTLPTKRIV